MLATSIPETPAASHTRRPLSSVQSSVSLGRKQFESRRRTSFTTNSLGALKDNPGDLAKTKQQGSDSRKMAVGTHAKKISSKRSVKSKPRHEGSTRGPNVASLAGRQCSDSMMAKIKLLEPPPPSWSSIDGGGRAGVVMNKSSFATPPHCISGAATCAYVSASMIGGRRRFRYQAHLMKREWFLRSATVVYSQGRVELSRSAMP